MPLISVIVPVYNEAKTIRQILEKIKVKTPNFIAKYLFGQKHSQKPKAPFIIGLFKYTSLLSGKKGDILVLELFPHCSFSERNSKVS